MLLSSALHTFPRDGTFLTAKYKIVIFQLQNKKALFFNCKIKNHYFSTAKFKNIFFKNGVGKGLIFPSQSFNLQTDFLFLWAAGKINYKLLILVGVWPCNITTLCNPKSQRHSRVTQSQKL